MPVAGEQSEPAACQASMASQSSPPLLPSTPPAATVPVSSASLVFMPAAGEVMAVEAISEEAAKRLEKRMISMCDRLWSKIARMQDEITHVHDESTRLHRAVMELSGPGQGIAAEQEDTQRRLDAAESGLQTFELELARVQKQVENAIESKIASLSLKADRADALSADLASQLVAMDASIRAVEGSVNALLRSDSRAELDAVGSRLEELDERLRAQLRDEFTKDLNSKLETLKGRCGDEAITRVEKGLENLRKMCDGERDERRRDVERAGRTAAEDIALTKQLLAPLGERVEELTGHAERQETIVKQLRLELDGLMPALNGIAEERSARAQEEVAAETKRLISDMREALTSDTASDTKRVLEEVRKGFKADLEDVAGATNSLQSVCQRIEESVDCERRRGVDRDLVLAEVRQQAEQRHQSLEPMLASVRAASEDRFAAIRLELSTEFREGFARCQSVCDLRADASEEWQRACTQQLEEFSRQTAASVQRLAEDCAAVRAELATLAVSNFQGELKLWKGMVLHRSGNNSSQIP